MKPNKRLLNILVLKPNEEILITLKIFPLRSLFINEVIERHAKYFILTNERVFIIIRGWGIKEVYPLIEFREVRTFKKWLFSGELPVISIKSHNVSLDIFFYSIFPYRKKIEEVVECIKKCNPKIDVKKDLREDKFISEIMSTKIKFK